jgi:hypothetical protein
MKKNPVMVAAGRKAAATRKANAASRSNAAYRAWVTIRKNKHSTGKTSVAVAKAFEKALQAQAKTNQALADLKKLL